MTSPFTRRLRDLSLALLAALGFLLGTLGWRTSTVHASPPGTWTATGSMNQSRDRFSGALLPSGKVLVAGSWAASNGAELYDPGSGTWIPAGNMTSVREHQFATLLPNGEVLEAGGAILTGGNTNTAELYTP
jgi:hypothetical protein